MNGEMNRRGPRLLLRFGLVSAIALAILGTAVALELRSNIREEAVDDARGLATLTARLWLQPTLEPKDLLGPLSAVKSARVTDGVRASLDDTHVVRVKVWNRQGLVVYSDDDRVQGRTFAIGQELGEALGGEVASEISHLEASEEADDRHYGQLVEVYVPLRFTAGGPVEGAFEVYVPYADVSARIAAQVRRVTLLLAFGLLLLWAALFRLVAGASRRLREQAEDNRRLAREDALTGLANRTSFLELAGDALDRRPALAAVLLLDLDRFKDLNDSLGHQAGDLLLREIGPRLRRALPENAVLARLGGDEFAALLAPLESAEAAEAVARRILAALAEPVQVEGIAVVAEASVGIAVYPRDGEDAAALLQHADVAMYAAKESRAGVAAYRPETDRSSHERLLVLAELREAIANDELVLHYQPKVALSDGRTVGVEALVRWEHPRRGLLGPDHFVGLAEHTGLIGPLTAWVLTRAMRDARHWWDAGAHVGVAVNLSVANLVDPELPGLVARLLGETRLPPSAIELEITESVLMTEPARALRTLSLLRSMGVSIAVDDYGTGHSSLAYLHQMPLDTLKIDRSFVASLGEEGDVIVRSTVDLAHNLGLRVVAEGIEDPETAATLRELGCDLGQGFHYARPVPLAAVMDHLAPLGWLATVKTGPAEHERPVVRARASFR
jgi:diguanylate cyclase (GGDEF)-like protein